MIHDTRAAGEGTLRRAEKGYAGEIELLGEVAEDGQGKFFKLHAYLQLDGMPEHIRIPILDDQ